MNLSGKEYLLLALILFSSFVLSIINNGYPLSGDERASLSSATGVGIAANRFQGNLSFRSTQASPLEKNIFTQHDYSRQNIVKNVLRSTVNFDSGNMVAYHLILHGWLNVLGISVFKARLLSALFAVLTVLFTFLIVQKLTGSLSVAFFSCIILSIHPLLLHFSHMARGYAASLCFTTAAVYLVLRITDGTLTTRKRIVCYLGFSILATLALLSHYLSVPIFIFLAIWLVTTKNFFKVHLFPSALALVITSSVIFWWIQNGGSEGLKEMRKIDEWYLKNASEQIQTSTGSLAVGTIQQLLAIFGNYGQYLGFRLRNISFLLVFPLGALLLTFNRFKSSTDRKAKNFLAGTVISIVVFSALLAVKSGHIISFNARYGIYSIPFACALLAYALDSLLNNTVYGWKKIFSGFCLAITFIIFVISAIPAYTGAASTYHNSTELHKDVLHLNLDKYFLKDGYEPFAKIIERSYAAGDTVIYGDWNTAQTVNLFLHDSDKNIIQKVTPGLDKILFYKDISHSYLPIPGPEN